jgi:hypothetical protein
MVSLLYGKLARFSASPFRTISVKNKTSGVFMSACQLVNKNPKAIVTATRRGLTLSIFKDTDVQNPLSMLHPCIHVDMLTNADTERQFEFQAPYLACRLREHEPFVLAFFIPLCGRPVVVDTIYEVMLRSYVGIAYVTRAAFESVYGKNSKMSARRREELLERCHEKVFAWRLYRSDSGLRYTISGGDVPDDLRQGHGFLGSAGAACIWRTFRALVKEYGDPTRGRRMRRCPRST